MKRFSGDRPEKKGPSTRSSVGKPGRPRTDSRKPYDSAEGKSESKRPFTRRESDGRDKPWKSDSPKPWRSDKSRSESSDRSEYKRKDSTSEDRKPYKRRDSEGTEGKPFKRRDSENSDRRPYQRRDSEGTERKAYSRRDSEGGDKPWNSDRKSSFSGKPRSDERGERTERRPYEHRDSEGGARKPYQRRDSEGGEKRSYQRRDSEGRERKPYQRRDSESGDRKPYQRRDSESGEKSPYQRRDSEGVERKPYQRRNPEGEERKTYQRRDSKDGERKPYQRRNSEGTDRPSFKRRDEDHSESPTYRKREFDSGDRPYKRRDTGYRKGDTKPFKKDFSKSTTSNDGSIRLNKYIANAGVCSRREADTMIEAGAITVNGVVVTELGTKVFPNDRVQIGNETLSPQKKVYVLLNKPKGYITTVDDPQERNTVMMLVKDACKERIYPVGRLDRNTSGLLLLTNDGEMAKKLTHPSHKVRKVYQVEVNRTFSKADMVRLTEGVELEDGIMAVDEIAYTGSGEDKKVLGVVIHSGKNRVVRRLFEALEYEVVKLDRVVFANLTKKDLPRGRWRFLEESEINHLMMM